MHVGPSEGSKHPPNLIESQVFGMAASPIEPDQSTSWSNGRPLTTMTVSTPNGAPSQPRYLKVANPSTPSIYSTVEPDSKALSGGQGDNLHGQEILQDQPDHTRIYSAYYRPTSSAVKSLNRQAQRASKLESPDSFYSTAATGHTLTGSELERQDARRLTSATIATTATGIDSIYSTWGNASSYEDSTRLSQATTPGAADWDHSSEARQGLSRINTQSTSRSSLSPASAKSGVTPTQTTPKRKSTLRQTWKPDQDTPPSPPRPNGHTHVHPPPPPPPPPPCKPAMMAVMAKTPVAAKFSTNGPMPLGWNAR